MNEWLHFTLNKQLRLELKVPEIRIRSSDGTFGSAEGNICWTLILLELRLGVCVCVCAKLLPECVLTPKDRNQTSPRCLRVRPSGGPCRTWIFWVHPACFTSTHAASADFCQPNAPTLYLEPDQSSSPWPRIHGRDGFIDRGVSETTRWQ